MPLSLPQLQRDCNSLDEAVFGRCGSGRDPDCQSGSGGDYYHGVQCCQLVSF